MSDGVGGKTEIEARTSLAINTWMRFNSVHPVTLPRSIRSYKEYKLAPLKLCSLLGFSTFGLFYANIKSCLGLLWCGKNFFLYLASIAFAQVQLLFSPSFQVQQTHYDDFFFAQLTHPSPKETETETVHTEGSFLLPAPPLYYHKNMFSVGPTQKRFSASFKYQVS